MRTIAQVKVFNYQEYTHKTQFGTSCGRTVFHLPEKPMENKYLEVLRILVPSKIVVDLEISANLRGTAYVQLNSFPDSIHQKDFDIYEPVKICKFPKKT